MASQAVLLVRRLNATEEFRGRNETGKTFLEKNSLGKLGFNPTTSKSSPLGGFSVFSIPASGSHQLALSCPTSGLLRLPRRQILFSLKFLFKEQQAGFSIQFSESGSQDTSVFLLRPLSVKLVLTIWFVDRRHGFPGGFQSWNAELFKSQQTFFPAQVLDEFFSYLSLISFHLFQTLIPILCGDRGIQFAFKASKLDIDTRREGLKFE